MPIGSERAAVQNPFLRYAEEAGWTYLSPEAALDLRRGITSPVLDTVFLDQIQKLNPGIVDLPRAEQIRDRFVRVRPNIEGNLTAWEYLKGLKTVFVELQKRELNVRVLDPVNLDANAFHVTDELTFSNGTPPDIRADLVFFVNGVPIIVGETKSSKKREGIAEAFDDLRYYHRHGPELLAVLQLHCLTHLVQFYYGATWNLTRKGLFNWRDEQAGDFETLVKTFVSPRRVLRMVTEFVVFTRKDGELEKTVLRPHQMRAAERCVARARDPKKRRGLIWHTQGSGKTYTMLTVAKRLIEDPVFGHPTVLMIVDRNELEAQLFGNLEAVSFGHVEVAYSKARLRDLLRADRRGLIVSMIHKFDGIEADVITRENVYVLVDEAHRSTGGDLGNYLMGALPNATYIGFTGTPIDRTSHGKGTFKVFGTDDPKRYLDKYSILESVTDGTTLPLHYELAPNDLLVDRATLEKEFLELAEAEGVADVEELNRVLDRAVNLKEELKNDVRVPKVAAFVADHFKSFIEPMGYKAFLVGVDREACVLYKKELDRHLPAEYSAVVISTMGKKDAELYKKYALTDDQEKAVRKRFRRPDEQPKILLVTEKLLTGFDAPILYCMYLDKPMRDHVLLQAIARVNRPYEDEEGRRKRCGFVLDFVGVFDRLEKALAFDSKDVEGVIEGLEVLEKRFGELMDHGRETYLPIGQGLRGDKAVEALLLHFLDRERREKFFAYIRELEELHEILSPAEYMRAYLDDYGKLIAMYRQVRSSFDRGISVDKSFLRKTAELVRKHTYTTQIGEPGSTYELDEPTLEAIANQDTPDTVKIFNLLKAIDELVESRKAHEPYLINIGEMATEIARRFEERQRTTQETLTDLWKLIQETKAARQEAEATELSAEAFAVYWMLKRDGVEKAGEVARAAADAFDRHPHWRTSRHQEQDVRKAFYKALIDAGVDGVVDVAQGILRMLGASR